MAAFGVVFFRAAEVLGEEKGLALYGVVELWREHGAEERVRFDPRIESFGQPSESSHAPHEVVNGGVGGAEEEVGRVWRSGHL